MCHGNVLVYTCQHRQVSEIQICDHARQPANHHGAWSSLVFKLAGKHPRRPCGTATTAERHYMAYPCAACSAALPPSSRQQQQQQPVRRPAPPPHPTNNFSNAQLSWDQAYIPTRAAPPPPPPQGRLSARPQRPARTTSMQQWQQDPSRFVPLSFSQRMAQQQQPMQVHRSLPTLPHQHRDMAAAARPAPRKLQKRRPPPTPISTRAAKRSKTSRRLTRNMFCLGSASSSEESLVCIDALRIEREGGSR